MSEFYVLELKSLILGLSFSLGIFAVKSGAGFAYLLQLEPRYLRRLWLTCAYLVSYATIFTLAWFLVCRINLLTRLDTVMLFFKNGMTLHFLLAALLLIWGITLLKQSPQVHKTSRAWLLLALPCPVCFSVILFSGAFLHNLLPQATNIFTWLFAGYAGLSLSTSFLLLACGRNNPEHTLGSIMILAALYFLVTIAVVPQFADIERIYRLSRSSVTTLPQQQLPLLLASMGAAFGFGFFRKARKNSWI